MGLTLYKKKRNFKVTSEPEGSAKTKLKKGSASKLAFVIQRHKASRLHYDFRLELDGVLKSWAVPKGPSLNPKDKRLAMMVEDHPYDYKNFAGVIPEGNYGAGIVEIWDHGTYSDLENSLKAQAEKNLRAGLKAGNLKVRLFGKKLKGEFALVKLKDSEDNAWLLIKHNDEYAVDSEYSSEEDTPKNSPINKWMVQKSKKKMNAGSSKTAGKAGLRFDRKINNFISPMLAKESREAFDDAGWIFEIKWDGYRAIAETGLSHGQREKNVKLYSRNGNSFEYAYPVVFDQLKKIKEKMILDGEIVVLNDEGQPDFQLLQHYESNTHRPIQYYVFDIIELNGKSLVELPLLERKKILNRVLKVNDIIKYSDHIVGKGRDFFEVVKEKNMEGVMAKKADSEYLIGKRTTAWLKVKHNKTLEAIIAGYTEPTGSRKFFGALVLGMMQKGVLKYVGHTGSGFDQVMLREMYKRLQPLVQKQSPFKEKVKTNTPVTWVKPVLICEVKYTEITRDGILRHPIFLRFRDDKKTKEITMAATKSKERFYREEPRRGDMIVDDPKDKPTDRIVQFGKFKVKVTNPDKLYFPDDGITKVDVVDYYISMADYILPYLKGRPESMLRNPNGITEKGFFHKDAGAEAPEFVRTHKLYSDSVKHDIDYIICDNKPTLTYMNNLGCIEINPWNSTLDAIDNPDYMIIDIDPSEKNTFDQVIEAANVVKSVLDKAGAVSYCKTSGSTGLHIYVPMGKKYAYEQVKDFALLICMLATEQLPGFTTLERNLKKRGNKRIYMDYLQNRKGQTISCVYSLRPKPGGTVSMPLEWKEVKAGLTPQDFNIHNALKRVKKIGDIFKPVLGKGIDLEKCLKKLEK